MSSKKPEIESDHEEEEEEEEDDDVDEQHGDENVQEENKEKQVEDVRNPDVVTKYRLASEIANNALRQVIAACVPGAKIVALCDLSDNYINDATSKVYNKGKVSKGVGFPTCISVNNVVGAFSPTTADETVLRPGDLVKIDLGVQVDGYVAQVAHSIVLPENDNAPVTGRKADVLAATFTAAQCALRLLKAGNKNVEVTRIVDKVAKDFNCRAVEGVFSHQVLRFQIDGEKVVANSIPEVPLTGENKTKECKFETHEAWSLDIVLTTGTGRPQPVDEKLTCVFKRVLDQNYKLKMKAPRAVLSEIDQRFPNFPFTMRALKYDANKLRFGVSNCVKHRLLEAYPVLFERDGEFVAHVKFTALLMPNGTLKITENNWDLTNIRPDLSVKDEEVKALLNTAVSSKKKKKKPTKKKKKKPAAGAAAPAAAAAAPAPAAASSQKS